MDLQTWFVFSLAVIGLSLAPGPNGLLALTHGAIFGYKRTLNTISGGIIGFVLLIALSMLGISALLQASQNVLLIMKWLGGAYLFWLGIQVFRSPPLALEKTPVHFATTNRQLFRTGFLAAVSNPKVLLFFSAFLPQFINPDASLFVQFVQISITFAVIEFTTEYLLAKLATKIKPWLTHKGKMFNRGCGGIFMLIGASLPLNR